MLKFFAGDVTPKPQAHGERNPFDNLTPSRKGSTASVIASGARTPTARFPAQGSFHLAPELSATGSQASFFLSSGGGAGDVTPGAPPVTPGGVATTGEYRLPRPSGPVPDRYTDAIPLAFAAISMVEPDFSFKTQPSSLARKKETALAPKGKLSVKLISARHLSTPSSVSRPYVVVTFDQNEFVSREPIHEEGEEVTGVAVPKEDSVTKAISPDVGAAVVVAALQSATMNLNGNGTSGLGRALHWNGGDTAHAAAPEPTAFDSALSSSAMEETPPSPPTESLSAYNPTWKHEVFLYVPATSLPPIAPDDRIDSDVMNEKSVVQVQIFDRSIEEEMFLGLTEIRPKLVNGHTVDQWFP